MFFDNKLSLNRAAKLTNITYPIKEYLTKDSFPDQDATKLNQHLDIKYRDYTCSKDRCIRSLDNCRLKNAVIHVLRYDIVSPFIVIGISISGDSKGTLFVLKRNENDSVNNYIAIYPEQQYNYYHGYTKDYHYGYTTSDNFLPGYILRCDNGEPCYAVIAEITNDNKLRFILSDEAICIIDDYPSTDVNYKESDIYNLVEQLLGEYTLYGTNDTSN